MYIAIILISLTGAISAFILYFLSKKFEVMEDPRIALVLEALPGANCGGCGYPGCAGFADACTKASSLDGLSCPVGKVGVMNSIAAILGQTASENISKIAVVRCNGSCDARSRTNIYDSAKTCAIASSLYCGETGCPYGCYGWGDCVKACKFDAIHINPTTGLAEVSEDKCTACCSCVKACPKNIIEMRNKGLKSRRIYVSCVNKDKGGVARKACGSACIGCNKCMKECTFDAISITHHVAYIDDAKCSLCGKCISVCPTGSIVEVEKASPNPFRKGGLNTTDN